MLDLIPDAITLHGLDEEELVPDIRVKVSASDPDLAALWLESCFYIEEDELFAERCLNRHTEVRVGTFIVDQCVMLRMLSPNLMSEDLRTSSPSIDLCIVETSKLVECDFTISVQDQHW